MEFIDAEQYFKQSIYKARESDQYVTQNRALVYLMHIDISRGNFISASGRLAEMEALIVAEREKHPAQGAKKIRRMLENEGIEGLPSRSTINEIFRRNGLIAAQASAAATPYLRFEKESPNDMLQMDFKGHFAMKDGKRSHPLTILDDCTRFCLCLDHHEHETFEAVHQSLRRVFEEYGLPQSILCDNGNPWGTAQSVGYTRLELWLMQLGILPKHGRVRHPQTQGKDERFNGTVKNELLKYTDIADGAHAQKKFAEFREFYNNVRPHHALNLDVPASRYEPSKRRLPKSIEPWDYVKGFECRNVKSSGYMSFRGQGYFLSEALGEETVGIRETGKDAEFDIFYRQFRIALLNADERTITSRRIRLPEEPAAEKFFRRRRAVFPFGLRPLSKTARRRLFHFSSKNV
jgi:transposase InsO family protein